MACYATDDLIIDVLNEILLFSASASIRITLARQPAARLSTRVTAIAMTTTTVKAVSTMAATVAQKP